MADYLKDIEDIIREVYSHEVEVKMQDGKLIVALAQGEPIMPK